MFSLITSIATLALAMQPVLAGIYITNPVASSKNTGGQVLTVKWADDGNAPFLKAVGPCSVDLYTGSVYKQVKLQNLAASVDVSQTASISTTIDPKAGQSGPYYFVRFTSLGLKDTTNPQYNYAAFSAKFTLDDMTGTFDAATLADLSSSGNSSAVVSAAASATSAKASTSASASKSAASGAATSSSAAVPQLVASTGLLAGVVGVVSWLAL